MARTSVKAIRTVAMGFIIALASIFLLFVLPMLNVPAFVRFLPALAGSLAVGGFTLWASDRKAPGSRSNLGAGLISGTLVAVSIFLLEEASEGERRVLANREAFQSTIAFTKDLSGADLRNRDLSDLFLANKILRGADLSDTNLSNAILTGTDLREAYLTGSNLGSARLADANLQAASLDDAELSGAMMFNAIAEEADFSGANLRDAYLDRANLRNARFESTASLRETSLCGADLRGADLEGTDLTGADLRLADLRGAVLQQGVSEEPGDANSEVEPMSSVYARFTGVDYDERTRWPTGFDPSKIQDSPRSDIYSPLCIRP